MKAALPHTIQKTIPHAKGVVGTTMVYIGVDKVFNFVDDIVGSPLLKIGVNVPLMGRISVMDVITYMAVAQGFKFRTYTVIAFFANKFLNQGIAAKPNIAAIANPVIQSPGPINVTQGAPL